MEVNKKTARLLHKTIAEWQTQQVISDEEATKLKQTIVVRQFDWKQVTLYAFIIAVACAVLSLIVLLADNLLQELIRKIMEISDAGISVILSVFAAFAFWFANRRKMLQPDKVIENNSFMLVVTFISITAFAYWAKTWEPILHNVSIVFLLACMLYVFLSIRFQSNALWILALLMLAIAFVVCSSFLENKEEKFLGMNYPMRFIPFSLLLLLAKNYLMKREMFKPFLKVHYITSLLFLFIAMWMLTIFGNYTRYERWEQVNQITFLYVGILFFFFASLGMYVGLKRNDLILGNISLLFFIINLLTRYFEYFWEPLHKSVFFLVLAFLFWFIGSRAEKLWNLRFLEDK